MFSIIVAVFFAMTKLVFAICLLACRLTSLRWNLQTFFAIGRKSFCKIYSGHRYIDRYLRDLIVGFRCWRKLCLSTLQRSAHDVFR